MKIVIRMSSGLCVQILSRQVGKQQSLVFHWKTDINIIHCQCMAGIFLLKTKLQEFFCASFS